MLKKIEIGKPFTPCKITEDLKVIDIYEYKVNSGVGCNYYSTSLYDLNIEKCKGNNFISLNTQIGKNVQLNINNITHVRSLKLAYIGVLNLGNTYIGGIGSTSRYGYVIESYINIISTQKESKFSSKDVTKILSEQELEFILN